VIARLRRGADYVCELRRLGVTAATSLLLAATFSGCTGSREALASGCTAKDRSFLQTATVDMTAFGIWRQDYAAGSISAKEAARAAFDAAERVSHVEPNHPSLRTAAQYLDGMFKTYGEAVRLRAQGKDDGERMYRAFTLAFGAQDVLAKAQPTLQQQGCDVGPLL
jgi:hypothetical protein